MADDKLTVGRVAFGPGRTPPQTFWQEAREVDPDAVHRIKDQGKVYNLLSTHGDPVRIAEGLGELIEAASDLKEIARRKDMSSVIVEMNAFDRLRRALKAIQPE